MTRRLNIWLLAIALLIGLPYWWLLLDSRPGNAVAKPVTIAQLRQLAATMPGASPSGVEVEEIAFRRLTGNLLVAGSGIKRQVIGIMAFRLPVPGGNGVIIDTGLSERDAADWRAERFHNEAMQRTIAAMRAADLILLTNEHVDRMGGLAALANTPVLAKVLAKAKLNAAQIAPDARTGIPAWAGHQSLVAAIRPGKPQAIAPGLVVIPAPSHTPGSQMIYVRLGSGDEYLFTGDIASMTQSWQQLRARSRLVSQFIDNEDRPEVFAWLRTIRKLKAEAPALHIVPGNDYEWLIEPQNRTGMMHRFFVSPQRNK